VGKNGVAVECYSYLAVSLRDYLSANWPKLQNIANGYTKVLAEELETFSDARCS
jgi:hypothetical protein